MQNALWGPCYLPAGKPTTKLLRIMKLTAIILLSACLTVSAKTHSQNVTLTVKDAPLEKVFTEIKRQTGYDFVYRTELLENTPKVNLSVNGASLQDVLDLCFKNQSLSYKIFQGFIAVKSKDEPAETENNLPPPPINVHGKIVNEKGEPVIATITIKGTRITVSTTDNGEFSISNVDPNAVLVISGVSIETLEVKINGRTELATLSVKNKISTGEEVTVNTYSNGYQQLPRERSTGSIDYIDNKTYNRGISTDVLSRLDGIANSLYYNKSRGGTNEIFIRGTSSITLSSQPLIVLDGFPYTGDYNNINPNDIESVTVLKDAAAASIWGARAGNGVIVLVSKKAKYNQKFQLNVNVNSSVQDKPNLFQSTAHIDASDFIDVEKFLFDKGFYNSDFTSSNHRVISPVVQILLNQRNGVITPDQATQQVNAYRVLDNRNQLMKYMYDRQVNQQYSLSMSGGNQVINYFLSGGYDRNDNIGGQPGNKMEKQTVHSIASFKPISKLDIKVGIDYTHLANRYPAIGIGSPGGGKGSYYPYAMIVDANGNALTLPRDYAQNFKDTAGAGKLLDWNYKPLDELNRGNFNNDNNDLLFNVSINYPIFKFLSASVQYQHEWNSGYTKNIYSPQTYYSRNMINLYTQRTPNGFTYPVPFGGIVQQSTTGLSRDNFRPMLSFNKSLSGKHELSAIAGFEVNQARTTGATIPTAYGYNDEILSTIPVNTSVSYRFFDNLGSGVIPSSLGFGEKVNRFVSYFTNIGYTFNKKYTFTASARKDQSNLFGVNTNNRGIPLWSSGLSWKTSNEPFYKSNLFPFLSMRASFGYSGNSSPSIPALSVISYSTNSYYTNFPYADVTTPSNPDLRWEKIGQLNIGVDFEMRNKCVIGSVEYYHKKGIDLLSSVPVDITTGFDYLTKNAANMVTNGVDISLNFKIIDRKNFVWNSSVNFNYMRNKVTKYLLKQSSPGGYVSGGGGITPREGADPYQILTYRFAGLDGQTGDPMGYVNGALSKDYNKLLSPASINELVEKGTNRPPFYGSVINNITWKGFSLSANISYKFGFYLVKPTINYVDFFNTWAQNDDYARRWQKPGDEALTTVPSMTYPANSNRDRFYQNSDATVIKGDIIKLQDIKLNYEFRPIKVGSTTIKQLNLFFYATNLGVVWRANKDKIDPDAPGGYSVPKMYAIGIHTSL